MPTDPTLRAADLTTALRAWLRSRHEPPHILAGALAYEMAALAARRAPSVLEAVALVDIYAAIMKEQITEFGVGEHP